MVNNTAYENSVKNISQNQIKNRNQNIKNLYLSSNLNSY